MNSVNVDKVVMEFLSQSIHGDSDLRRFTE